MDSILDMTDYSRQEDLDDTLSSTDKSHVINVIVGCGGIGFWLGIFLAMLGYKNFILFEGSTIDNSNLNRLPVPASWVGINKAVALRKIIRSMRVDTSIVVVDKNIGEESFSCIETIASKLHGVGYRMLVPIVWDTTDDGRIQTKLYEYVQRTGSCHYRKLGYEGFKVGSYGEYNNWVPEGYTTGYRTSNANAITSAIAAGIGIFSRGILTEMTNMEIDLEKIIEGGVI